MNICGKDIALCVFNTTKKIQDLEVGDVLVGGRDGSKEYQIVHSTKFSGMVYPVTVGEHQFQVSETTKLLVRCMHDCEYGKKGEFARIHPESIYRKQVNYELVKPGVVFGKLTVDLFPANIACLGRWVATSTASLDSFYTKLKKRKRKMLQQLLDRNGAKLSNPTIFPGITFSSLETRFSFIRGVISESQYKIIPCVECKMVCGATLCKYVLMFHIQSIQLYSNLCKIIGSLGYHCTRSGLLVLVHGNTKGCLKNLLRRKWKTLPALKHSCQFKIEHSKPEICHSVVVDVLANSDACVYGPDFVQI